MSNTAIIAEQLSKAYLLGEISTGTLSRDLERWWAKARGRQDPFLKIGNQEEQKTSGKNDLSWSLKDLNFEIKSGDTVGIIGRNGAGKSTLLKILSRVTLPTNGTVKIRGRIASLLEVGTGFHPDLTGRENIFLNGAIMGMRKAEIKKNLDEIIAFSGVSRYIDTPVKRYSSGMYVRLAFAVAAHLDSEILVVDEVLAVGDAAFQKKCLGKIDDVSKQQGRTVLFVSHNMDAIMQLCRHSMLLQAGRLHSFANTREVVNTYLQQDSELFVEDRTPGLERPKIRRVEVDPTYLSKGHFKCTISFESPFLIEQPNIGLVMKTATGSPIFGTNFNLHPGNNTGKSVRNGQATVTIMDVPLYSGLYTISIYLGDEGQNYDEKPDHLTFELISGNYSPANHDINIIGPVKLPASWTLS
ncbi:polysaccharide ABC transporter, ATPase component [Pedobacter sp. BAL39]|uniref:ABC transporter ATP-binding protein n=1 Tax=Pedobacter sp. BAL39 TaxID=391596 RepID=UPI00015593E9|nr:ABC transporter ATP-binding protein [Pedobacter sp. BAL39]EDM37127.1 polysaccharide ABC transporter, ATPase component [Pedobacter sp. BAL39]